MEASLVYRVSSKTARATQRNSVSKNQKKKKKKKKKKKTRVQLPAPTVIHAVRTPMYIKKKKCEKTFKFEAISTVRELKIPGPAS